jgi:V-type H+-transporting ATPase subunit a
MIETIEFVLGSVSHTASYLRLWALSLAHGQLSEVFFNKTMAGGVEDANIVALVIGFYIFAGLTLGIIMMMDVMECFLHTLRLHWVEFQS